MYKWNLLDVEITEQEKQELSDYLYQFHDEYENGFFEYFTKGEEAEEFVHWHRKLGELLHELLYRNEKK